MTLTIATYVPEGIVLASDSRQSITIEGKTPDGKDLPKIETVNSDSVYKTFLISRSDKSGNPFFEVGVSTFGLSLLGGIAAPSHIKRFIEQKVTDGDDVNIIAENIFKYFKKSFPTADIGFHVAGYKKENKTSIPYVYHSHIENNVNERKNIDPDGNVIYSATWSGQADIISGLINPIIMSGPGGKQKVVKRSPPIAWKAMPLQDAIDFSIFAIRTTIETIRFQARPKNVGGPIDVLVITPEGAKWIQRKELKIE